MMRLFLVGGIVGWCVLGGGCGGGGSAAMPADAAPGDGAPPPPDARPPTSDDLIDDAVAAGTISEETGLVYHVFAAFGDTRLPAEYQGGQARGGTQAMLLVAERWDGLSGDTQAILEPFTLPPAEPGSWVELPSAADPAKRAGARTIEWSKVTAQGGAVTVWSENRYPGEDALAQTIAAELDAKIWKKLTGAGADELGMKGPASDDGLMHNGGDASFDIYLVHKGSKGDYGATTPYRQPPRTTCGPWPSYITINTQVSTGTKLFPTTAHELMHALQNAYPARGACEPHIWWEEATATWVEDFVYPDRDSEHEYVDSLIGLTYVPLESTIGNHEYGAYLFPFLVHRKYNRPRFVTRSFELRDTRSALAAIDAALTEIDPKGFANIFPEFALRNWNQEPVTDYDAWDEISQRSFANVEIEIEADSEPQPLPTKVKHLATHYLELTFAAEVKQILLLSGIPEDSVQGRVWIIPEIGGQWKQPEVLGVLKEYCRETEEGNVSKLILVISNSESQDTSFVLPDELIKVSGMTASCKAYSGTADLVETFTGENETITMTVHARPTFKPVPDEFGLFELTELVWSFHQREDVLDFGCRIELDAQGTFDPGPSGTGDSGDFRLIGIPPKYRWGMAFGRFATATQVTDCNSQHQDEITTVPMTTVSMGPIDEYDLAEDGSASGTEVDGNATLTWSFQP